MHCPKPIFKSWNVLSESGKTFFPGTGTGHFTQVVWKNSKEIGVGKAFSRDNRVYVVALYYPAGNYVGRENYEKNVQPLKHE